MKYKIRKIGTKAEGVDITGNPKKCEPETFRIAFPFGEVEVTRATDGPDCEYWVHVYVNNPESPSFCPNIDCGPFSQPGQITDARLDQTDKHASDSDVGDFERPELYHLAVKIGPAF